MALAMEWVSRIFAITLEMILPGLGGMWLDSRWGTNYVGLVGFVLGISLAIYHLLVMTKASAERERTERARRGQSRNGVQP
jgi:hypothetical protein